MELSKRVYLNDEFAETMFKKKKIETGELLGGCTE